MLQIAALLLSVAVLPSLQQTAQCSSPPMPDLNGDCPALSTFVTGGCCPDTDLIAPVVTSTTVVTDPTASTTTASTVTVTSRTVTNSSCVDLVNPRTGVSDCPAMASFCTNSVYLDVMRVQCRRTCGFCTNSTTTTNTTCVDLTNPATGVSDCPQRTALCNNSAYIALMRVQCPRSCGFCTSTSSSTTASTSSTTASSTCVDLTNPATGTSECAQNIALCNNAAYATLMRQQCPRTCGFCTVG